MKKRQLSCILFLATLFSPLAVAQDEGLDMESLFEDDFETEPSVSINDPLEGVNRVIFKFNDAVYTSIAKPFARTYTKFMPDPVERGIYNVFDNIKFPSRFVSNALQGRWGQAGKETGKFAVNTTIGILGIFRASDKYDNLQTTDEDMGQAFAQLGFGHGFYLVIPFMGPTSLRDFAGDLADNAVEPLPAPWTVIDDSTERLLIRAVEIVNNLPSLMDLYDSMRRSAIDPYASVRDAYAQRRARLASE